VLLNNSELVAYDSEHGDDDGINFVRDGNRKGRVYIVDIPLADLYKMQVAEEELRRSDEMGIVGMSVALLRTVKGTILVAYNIPEWDDGEGTRMCRDFVRDAKSVLLTGESLRRISVGIPVEYVLENCFSLQKFRSMQRKTAEK
jgi:hypothetical protein